MGFAWSDAAGAIRVGLSLIQLILVLVGTSTLVMIIVTIVRSKVRMMTNVYVVSLCLANFLYLLNLSLVAATQLNQRSWPFGPLLCSLYHGTETTGKLFAQWGGGTDQGNEYVLWGLERLNSYREGGTKDNFWPCKT